MTVDNYRTPRDLYWL